MQKMVKFQYTSTENVCQTMSTLYVKKRFTFTFQIKTVFTMPSGIFQHF